MKIYNQQQQRWSIWDPRLSQQRNPDRRIWDRARNVSIPMTFLLTYPVRSNSNWEKFLLEEIFPKSGQSSQRPLLFAKALSSLSALFSRWIRDKEKLFTFYFLTRTIVLCGCLFLWKVCTVQVVCWGWVGFVSIIFVFPWSNSFLVVMCILFHQKMHGPSVVISLIK